MAIDWTKPLETTNGIPCALMPSGIGRRVAILDDHKFSDSGRLWPAGEDWLCDESGFLATSCLFRIRNVPEPAAQPMYDRMLAFVERIARNEVVANDEARAIMAELRPVDPDLVLARNLAADACEAVGINSQYVRRMREGCHDDVREVRAALAGIRGRLVAVDGRELAVQS